MTSTQKSRSTTPRLSAENFTEHALAVLMAEGPGSIKIARICADLGVTKGSFYWHFADLDALMAALADSWCTQTRELLVELDVVQHLPPLERIRAMALRLVDENSWQVERALREWGRTDEAVSKVLHETEMFIFGVTQAALIDLGLGADAARMRAGLLVYAGIGFAHGGQALPTPDANDIDDLIEFIAGGVKG
jgi:AcrR family transcriptional regulator